MTGSISSPALALDHLLERRLLLFTGKGGVGKSTVVAALAVPLLGSADAENRPECERFVLLTAGAGQLLVLLWALALALRGLLN